MINITPQDSDIANALTAQLKAEVAAPKPLEPVKKCNLKDALPASVIQMVESFPQNETVRSVVCAHLKVPIPKECETFQQIQNWIEATIDPPKSGQPNNYIIIPLSASSIECGRCEYSVSRSGNGNFKVTDSEMIAMLQEAEDCDDLKAFLTDLINNKGGASLVDMDDDGNYGYINHEATSIEDVNWDYSERLALILKDAVRRLDPDKASDWGI
jgi:hypothetical protein